MTFSTSTLARRWSFQLWVNDDPAARSRRSSDIAAVVLSSVGLAILSLAAVPPSSVEHAITNVIEALPANLNGFWKLLLGILVRASALLAVAALVRKRWAVLRDLMVGLGVAAVATLFIGRLVAGAWTLVWSADVVEQWVPWLQLIVPVTIFLVAGPHLTRPARRMGRWLMTLGWLGATLALLVTPSMGAASMLVAFGSAATVALIFGTPKGRPDLETVRQALLDLGVSVDTIGIADRETEGVFVLDAVTTDGAEIEVKVYGRDAYDTQVVATVWRTVWFRRPGAPVAPGRTRQVEHEALLTMFAAQTGALTQRVVTAGEAANGDALLVLTRSGATLADEDWNRDLVAQLFSLTNGLHQARIVHGQVDRGHLFVSEGQIGLSDFRGARLTSGDPWPVQVDRAQALATAMLAVGPDTAIELATAEFGAEALTESLPFLQGDALGPEIRRGLKAAGLDLDSVRQQVAEAIGAETPELVKLRRITLGSILKAVLPVLAFLALASIFTGLDLADLAETLAGASWWFIAVGLIVAQLPRLTQTLTVMGASPIAIPMGRLYLLQLAQSYIALTIPGGTARIALNVRFFQRHGLPAGTALVVGAIDGFTGFLSQIVLVLLVLSMTTISLDLDLDTATSSGLVTLLLVIIGIALVGMVVIALIPKLRHRAVEWLKGLWTDALDALKGLASPRRLALLFGGGVATELLFALSLGAFAVAVGYPVGLPELILIVVLVGVLAGVLPVPGGIGVVEAGVMFGLARAGMPEETAFAVAILYRTATYYLPPVWGAFAFRHLEKDGHL